MLFHVGIEFLDIVNFIFSAIALVAHEPMGFLLGQVLELLERGLKEANLSMHLKMLLTRKYRKFFPNRRPTIAVVDTTPVPHPSAHLRILTQLYRSFAILWQPLPSVGTSLKFFTMFGLFWKLNIWQLSEWKPL